MPVDTSGRFQEPLREQRVLGDLVREQAETQGNRTFLIFEGQEYSFREIDRASNRVAHGLRRLGVGKGDKVALALPNSPAFVHLVFGLAKLGAVQVAVNTGLRGATLAHVLNHSDAGLVVVGESVFEHVTNVLDDLDTRPQLVLYGSGGTADSDNPAVAATYEQLMNAPADPVDDVEIQPSDPLAIFYTSGTTGPAKGVVLPHNYPWWHAQQRIRLLNITPEDRWYTCLPLFHVNAQYITLITSWVAGATAILGERFSASRFWDDIRNHDVTVFNLIGSMATILLNQPPDPKDGQHSVRMALIAALPKNFDEFERRFRLHCIQTFGMTECSPILVEPLDATVRPTLGKAIAGHEVRVVDDNDQEVPNGVTGELIFRPHTPYSMMLGYYKQPEATLQAMRNLWFHTGDSVYRDDEGYFYYVDRKKDSIRRRGENISTYEVESVVNSHPAVAESVALPVPSELGEDDVKIAVVLMPDARLTPEELIAFCEPRLPVFALPRYVQFIEELPKTQSTFRVEKYKLRDESHMRNSWDRLAQLAHRSG